MSLISKEQMLFLRKSIAGLLFVLIAPLYASANSILFSTFWDSESFAFGTGSSPAFNRGFAIQFTSLYAESLSLAEVHIPLSRTISSSNFTATVTLFADGGKYLRVRPSNRGLPWSRSPLTALRSFLTCWRPRSTRSCSRDGVLAWRSGL